MPQRPTRYTLPDGPEVETQPGSRGRVLLNRPGVRSKREMDRREEEALRRAQNSSLAIFTAQEAFTAERICDMHRIWLGDLYDWAGAYRTVNLEKPGMLWPPHDRIAQNMGNLEQGLLKRFTPCTATDVPVAARQIAEVHAELLFIHPFREGNGRLARWLANLMVVQAGFPIPVYAFTGPKSGSDSAFYLRAVKEGYKNKFDNLTQFFVSSIERALP